jgi:hypothetical protein
MSPFREDCDFWNPPFKRIIGFILHIERIYCKDRIIDRMYPERGLACWI